MTPRNPNTNSSDHDLLVRLDTKMDVLQSTVQETRTALSARIDRLAQEKASYGDLDLVRKTVEDYQRKNEKLEEQVDGTRRMIWIGAGVLSTLQFLAPFVWAKLFR